MDYPGSPELRAMLVRDGLRVARLQADRVNRVAGASGLGGGSHRPTDRQGGDMASDLEMTMSKWRTIRERPLLMITDGGKR